MVADRLTRTQAQALAQRFVEALPVTLNNRVQTAITNQIANYINNQGQAALRDIGTWAQNNIQQFSGVLPEMINNAGRHIQRQAQEYIRAYNAPDAHQQQQLQRTQTRQLAQQSQIQPEQRQLRTNQRRETRLMQGEDRNSMIQQQMEISQEIFTGNHSTIYSLLHTTHGLHR